MRDKCGTNTNYPIKYMYTKHLLTYEQFCSTLLEKKKK
jgi:hypothetical protein